MVGDLVFLSETVDNLLPG